MKFKSPIFLVLTLMCVVLSKNNYAQFYGMENNGDGSYTFYMNGGSITTNTQGVYSVSNNQGTYCNGCYGVAVYGYSTPTYYSPTIPNQSLSSQPPSSYSTTNVVNNNQIYYNASGQIIATIPFGSPPSVYGITGYTEGCSNCAQSQAQQQASSQWNTTNVNLFYAQSTALQQQELAAMQSQMAISYNQSNAYDYYYYYYAIKQITGNAVPATPLPPPPRAPSLTLAQEQTPPTTTNPARLPAELQGNRTYVAPNGTPIKLPANAQIGGLLLDTDDFVNGALYSFEVNGKKYAASESFYTQNSSAGEPQFRGYYEVVDGKCDLTKPYIFSVTDYPVTNNSNNPVINVVRIRQEVSSSNCKLVQEIVSHTVYSGTPYTIPNVLNGGDFQVQNTDIEYSPVVPGTTSNSTSTKCAGPQIVGETLQAYSQGNTLGGAPRVAGFLSTPRTKNSVKIYLFDCGTGTAKYTITKDGVKTLTTAEQAAETAKYNNGNFQSTDQDIAIKGCIQNGKWQYDVKFNNTKLTPHPKIAPVINEVKAEIARQAADATKKLKLVEKRANGENVSVEDGESFSKTSMDIFETLSAIYDIGKDIINEGRMPEMIWDGGKRANNVTDGNVAAAHSKSPYKMPTLISGCTDQLIDEATGAVQLTKTVYDFVLHPKQTAATVWNGVKTLDRNKITQVISSATGYSNVTAGGDRLKYQGGRYSVQAAMIIVGGLKVLTKGAEVVDGAGKKITDIETFIPDGSTNHPSTNAIKNATTNNKVVDNISNEKLLTKNVATNGDQMVVGIEKNGANSTVYSVKETELIDHRSGTTYNYNDILESAKDVELAKTSTVVNGVEEITTAAGKKGGWSKELNNPKANKVYKVSNSNAGHPHKYTTGVGGRVEKVEADLTLTPRDRNGYQQSVKCNTAKGGVAGSDQGGHLLASRFDGAGEQINLVPMKSSLNSGAWKTMENSWANALQQGKTVKVEIIPAYVGTSLKPAGFTVNYWINNVKTTQTFTN